MCPAGWTWSPGPTSGMILLLLKLLLLPSPHYTAQHSTDVVDPTTDASTERPPGNKTLLKASWLLHFNKSINQSNTIPLEKHTSNKQSLESPERTFYTDSNHTVTHQTNKILPIGSNGHPMGVVQRSPQLNRTTLFQRNSSIIGIRNRTFLQSNLNMTVSKYQFVTNITGIEQDMDIDRDSREYPSYESNSEDEPHTGLYSPREKELISLPNLTFEAYTQGLQEESGSMGNKPAATKTKLSDLFSTSARLLDSVASQGVPAITDRTRLDRNKAGKSTVLQSTEASFLHTDRKHNGSLIIKTLTDIIASNTEATMAAVEDRTLKQDITTEDIPYHSLQDGHSLSESASNRDQYDPSIPLKDIIEITTSIPYQSTSFRDSHTNSEWSRDQNDLSLSSKEPQPSHQSPSQPNIPSRMTTMLVAGGRASRKLIGSGREEEEGDRAGGVGLVTVGMVIETSVGGEVEVEQLMVEQGLTLGHVVLLGVAILGAALLAFTNMVGVCCCKSYFKTRRQGPDLLYRAVPFSRDVTRNATGSDVTDNPSRGRRSRGFSLRTRDSVIRRLTEERNDENDDERNTTSGTPLSLTTMTSSRSQGLTQRFYNVQEQQQRRRGRRVQQRRTLFQYGHAQEEPSCV